MFGEKLKILADAFCKNSFPSTMEAARTLNLRQSSVVNCCNGGYWRNSHTKFIKTTRAKQYIFKYKRDEVNSTNL